MGWRIIYRSYILGERVQIRRNRRAGCATRGERRRVGGRGLPAPIVKQLYNYRTAVINCRPFQHLPRREQRERARESRLAVSAGPRERARRGINSLTLHRETYLPVKLVGRRVRDYLLKQFPNVDRRRRRMT